MSLNIELAEQILNQIKSKPKTHYQGHWWDDSTTINGDGDSEINTAETVSECGATACVAGWALLFSGYKFRVNRYHDEVKPPNSNRWFPFPGAAVDPLIDGAELLGIDSVTARDLFHSEDEERAIAVLEDLIDAEKTARQL